MKHINGLFSVVVLLFSLFFSSVAQDITVNDENGYEAIPISKIPDYQIEATRTAFKVNQFLLDTADLLNWKNELKDIQNQFISNKQIFDSLDTERLSNDQLRKWDRYWMKMESTVNSIYSGVDEKLFQFNGYYAELDNLYKIWLETAIDVKSKDIPSNLKESVTDTKNELRALRKKIKEKEASYLSIKYDCNTIINRVSENKNEIKLAHENIVKNLLVAEQPVIWKALFEDYNSPVNKLESHLFEDAKANVVNYFKETPTLIYLTLLVFVFVIIAVLYFKRYLNSQQILEKIERSRSVIFIVKRPVLLSLFATWVVVISIFYLPIEIRSVFLLIMLIPLILTIVGIYGRQKSVVLFLFGFYYLLNSIKFLLNQENIIVRFILILVALLSLFLIWYLLNRSNYISKNKKWGWAIQLVLAFILLMLSVAFLFLLTGNVYLGKMLLVGSISIVLIGIFFSIIYNFYSALLAILFALPIVQKSNIVKQYSNDIISFLRKIGGFILIIPWLNLSLNDFAIKSNVYQFLLGIFKHQFTIGSTSFGLNNIFAFVFAIYCSIWIARIILVVLQEEIFVRKNVDKGMSSTITLLLRYSLIGLGFLFALAAAGIELEKISIIIGALGVGIGFGLQNIFNNLFSGIILALERPIKVDDIIQVGELTGVVKEIGFRASIVRTYDGSDVIVPNGDIISNQMINWTHSDRKRRLKIDLGVSYDADPEEVISILREVVVNHPMVEENPPPRPRFLGFGESSLDFQLLFWITDFDNGFGVSTEITLNLHKKLKERGIEIPYPKRDITITREMEK